MNATYKDLLEVTNKVNGEKIFSWLFMLVITGNLQKSDQFRSVTS